MYPSISFGSYEILEKKKKVEWEDLCCWPSHGETRKSRAGYGYSFQRIIKSSREDGTNVFGHQEIKRAILLMLMVGVHKSTHRGINLNGDISRRAYLGKVSIPQHVSCM